MSSDFGSVLAWSGIILAASVPFLGTAAVVLSISASIVSLVINYPKLKVRVIELYNKYILKRT